ncbi:MAG: glycine betaine ABC transporter substrate-binding protein [Janthinobacterium lividum]
MKTYPSSPRALKRRSWKPPLSWLSLFVAAALALPLHTARAADDAPSKTPVVVGGKNFTEQLILSSITAQYLDALGYHAVLKNGLGSTLMRAAQVSGQLDVVWEYTGTSLILYNHVNARLDEAATYARVKTLDAARGLVWLDESGINNTYAVAMPRAAAGDLRTLSDLADRIRQDPPKTRHLMAMDAEFAGRSDGLRPLLKQYGITLRRRDIKQMDPGLVYTALKNGQVTAGVVYTTDGRVQGFDLQLLDDDAHYFPAYRATPVVRQATLDAHPALATQLNALAVKLDTPTMTALNARVDIEQQSIARVAHDFLLRQQLIPQ